MVFGHLRCGEELSFVSFAIKLKHYFTFDARFFQSVKHTETERLQSNTQTHTQKYTHYKKRGKGGRE